MKKHLATLAALSIAGAHSALAVITSASVENILAVIPDGNFNGVQSTLTLNGLDPQLSDVNVTLTLSGGFNGDYYAFLSHNGTISVLLNRPGVAAANSVGYPDTGFGPNASNSRFTFDDQATNDVHRYRSFSFSLNGTGQLTGAWQPDGRNIDPLSSGSLFDSASRSSMLSGFNGMNPNGQWTLFVADMSPGGEGTLVNWGVQLTTVPEPSVCALFGLGTVGLLIRSHRKITSPS